MSSYSKCRTSNLILRTRFTAYFRIDVQQESSLCNRPNLNFHQANQIAKIKRCIYIHRNQDGQH